MRFIVEAAIKWTVFVCIWVGLRRLCVMVKNLLVQMCFVILNVDVQK